MVVAMIEPESDLCQMQRKDMLGAALKLLEVGLGEVSKGFGAVNVRGPVDKLVLAVADAVMLVKPHVHQPVVAQLCCGPFSRSHSLRAYSCTQTGTASIVATPTVPCCTSTTPYAQSCRGECYNNAPAERLWSRLKTEVLELREWLVFADLADAQASVADYFTQVAD